jgi:magnesium transporter
MPFVWYDIRNPNDPELDRLAERYHLHPLHIEDCRHRNQRAKVEEGADYIFTVVKPIDARTGAELSIGDLDLFLGGEYLITVLEEECATVAARLDQLHAAKENHNRADQLFYKILDGVVDSYLPILDRYNDTIDEIEDAVLEDPRPETLERIFETKRGLIELRRVLTNMRDVAGHLQRTDSNLIDRGLWPFLRDVYDHLARNLDLLEMQRDLLTGSMDIYLSSVANSTNQVMKVLTVLGTIALPAIVVSGFYGMNTKGLPLAEAPHAAWIAAGIMAVITAILLWVLKRFDWL